MKAVTAVCASAGACVGGVSNGRVHRQRRDVENEEIQMYLSKLKELVPFMPKNRRLSKLEVIQYVIDYICDLQYALETHPAVNSVITASTTTPVRQPAICSGSSPRQPLGVIVPNAIISNTSCSTQEQHNSMTPTHADKVPPSDHRPVSC